MMKLEAVRDLLNCRVLAGDERLAEEVRVGCGADLMSDVLAFIKPQALLLTGLTNVQSVRAAEIAEVKAIVYVRGKLPDKEAVELAKEKGMVVLATALPMYESCGRLYARGLAGGSEFQGSLANAEGKPVLSTL